MLTADIPLSSQQRYLGQERVDMTMIYAEVADPFLRQDYYQSIAVLDPTSANLLSSNQETFRQLIEKLKTPGLDQTRYDEILEQMQCLLENTD